MTNSVKKEWNFHRKMAMRERSKLLDSFLLTTRSFYEENGCSELKIPTNPTIKQSVWES